MWRLRARSRRRHYWRRPWPVAHKLPLSLGSCVCYIYTHLYIYIYIRRTCEMNLQTILMHEAICVFLLAIHADVD
jgi:hypothetical protein